MTPAERSARMRQLIAASGLSARQVAEALGVTRRAVECWLTDTDSHRNPPLTAIRLAEKILKGKGESK